ncbi:MAG: hypothetical protein K1X38_12220 [Microthrixaceae bacterium]|nr:hypothetical protein [Microthrixaceae bacterium]
MSDRAVARSIGDMVAEFHRAFALPIATAPGLDVSDDLLALRRELIDEERRELDEALTAGNLIGVADALGDLVYVIYGAALTFGIDLDAVIAEIHRSNMTKLGDDGRPVVRDDGKVLKGPRYEPPDVAGILRQL